MPSLHGSLVNSHTQILLLSVIIFLTFGMYISITNIGNGGQESLQAASYGNLAQNLTCMLSGPFMGGLVNYFGPRWTVLISAVPFALYTASLLAYPYIQSGVFIIVAGALLGVGSAGVWTPQGIFANNYVGMRAKGAAISFFFIINALSGVLAGALVLGMNFKAEATAISTATYAAFLGLGVTGIALSLGLVDITKVRLPDGSVVRVDKFVGWRTELRDLLHATVAPRMLVMAPFLVASQWYSPYQFNGYNAYFFNVRSRGANLLFYRLASIASAFVCSWLLDRTVWTVRRRGLVVWLLITVLFVGSWAGGLYVQFTDPSTAGQRPPHIDIATGRYWALWPIFTIWGFIDIANNAIILWLIGCLSPQANTVALYTGAMIAWQSLGQAVPWAIDASGVNYRVQCAISAVLGVVGLGSLLVASIQLPDRTEYFGQESRLAIDRLELFKRLNVDPGFD
ncbi:hypothetical protein IWQ60_003945 [Tieghemiomyces parasiticus]|uniref:Uncharacterized protein n=1 Tax=Tieghemiomyces parasiticus TaxID=78921 RepID=A0A9W8AGM4_9FUNG|nr:hypothetical protein IWQ60_003945 [Tieghemiomyces parasiticus]